MRNEVWNCDVRDGLDKIPKNTVHLIVTSPPYNIGMNYDNYEDNLPFEDYFNFLNDVWIKCKEILVDGGRICINVGESNTTDIRVPTHAIIINQLLQLGFKYRSMIIWNKFTTYKYTAWGSYLSCSNPHTVPRHEYILVFSKGSMRLEGDPKNCDLKKHEFLKYVDSIWNITPSNNNNRSHPATFPKELVKRLIKLYSYKGNIILDPFGGIGTTAIVAKSLERNYIIIEQSKKYCGIARNSLKQENIMNFIK